MNRGFGFYFERGVKSSAQTILKNRGFIRYFIFAVMEIIARLLIIPGVIFDLARVRQAKIVKQHYTVDISQSLKSGTRAHAFGTYFTAVFVEILMSLAGLIAIGVCTSVLMAIGYALYLGAGAMPLNLWLIIFSAPGMLCALVYLFLASLIFAPTAYIIDSNEKIGVADTISACFRTMKSAGKVTCFLNHFVPALCRLVICGFCTGGFFIINSLMPLAESPAALTIVNLIWAIVSLGLLVFIAPVFTVAARVANTCLFEDIAIDPRNAQKRTTGVYIKNCRGKKLDPKELDSNLVLLFEESEYDDLVVEQEFTRQGMSQREERKQKKLREIALRELQKPKSHYAAQEETEQVSPVQAETEQTSEPKQPLHAVKPEDFAPPASVKREEEKQPEQPLHAVKPEDFAPPASLKKEEEKQPEQPLHAVKPEDFAPPASVQKEQEKQPEQPLRSVKPEDFVPPASVQREEEKQPEQPLRSVKPEDFVPPASAAHENAEQTKEVQQPSRGFSSEEFAARFKAAYSAATSARPRSEAVQSKSESAPAENQLSRQEPNEPDIREIPTVGNIISEAPAAPATAKAEEEDEGAVPTIGDIISDAPVWKDFNRSDHDDTDDEDKEE